MVARKHPLHTITGDIVRILERKFGKSYEFLYDRACMKGDEPSVAHQLPLFIGNKRTSPEKYCQVDVLILRKLPKEKKEIAVVIEIEETGISQIKILGKFLTSALCKNYLYESEELPVPLSSSVLFIQVIRERNESKYRRQKWDDIDSRTRAILPIKGSGIIDYRLIHGSLEDFDSGGRLCAELSKAIADHLKKTGIE